MINIEKLKPILAGYKVYFPSHWDDEKYKWEAIKHFQDHWDIQADDFAEMLKTPDCGQFSYFTAHPGITRGGHYHHSKTEKFLVIKGQARFKFRHMQTGQVHELVTDGAHAQIVETVPGWTHDITNIGPDELVVMLWANEVFDRDKPDTFACAL